VSEETPLVAALPRLPADGFAALRKRAREAFVAQGLPNRRNESYKYTDLTPLGTEAWPRANGEATAPALPEAMGRRHLWVDGRLEGDDGADGVTSLRGAAESPDPALTGILGQRATADDPVVALNTALFDHGAWIDIPAGERREDPVELLFATGEREEPAATHGRLAVHLGRDSHLVLIERHAGGDGPALSTRVAEFALEAGAELVHVRINEAGDGTWLLGHTAVDAAAGARYRYIGLDFGGKLARERLHVALSGDEADAELAGLAVLDGRRHADSDVLVVHDALRTRSRQFFRGVLDGRSRSAYTGKVRVEPGAQKSDAGQEAANLLLSRRAEADTRPQLEIYADDVACNHGAATGAIDAEALFYLQSRGVDADTARRMIAYGFAARVFAGIGDDSLRRALSARLAERMQTTQEVREWL